MNGTKPHTLAGAVVQMTSIVLSNFEMQVNLSLNITPI